MNTLPKVDVLGVIDREITTRDDAAIACKAAGERLDALVHAEERDELKAARAAVAELIDSQRELLALVEQWAVQIEGEWGMCRDLDELEKDGELRPEIIRARAALARIGGAA